MNESEYASVLIRPSDEHTSYWIVPNGDHSIKILQGANILFNTPYVEPIVISRHDWNLYVGAAQLCGFAAVAHYARAQQNKAKWEDEKNIFRMINARRTGKSFLNRLSANYGYKQELFNSLELNQEWVKQHVTGTWLNNDDIVDATSFAVLNRKINAKDL